MTSDEYADDVIEVQSLGGDDITTPSARTADQTEIALFFLESSPQMWNRIARQVSETRHLDSWESARLFGLLNMALTDGYIGSFKAKYHYRFWRPITAIRLADIDGNAATSPDPTWTPLRETPPIPDYDSGHAVEGGAAAQVLRRFFHTDKMTFSTCSYTLPAGQTCADPTPTIRTFTHFSEAEIGERHVPHLRGLSLPRRGGHGDSTRSTDRGLHRGQRPEARPPLGANKQTAR